MEEINQKIYDKAISLLSIRMHTTGELQRKLRQRGFSAGEIFSILRRLEELDFLNDQKFAEIFVDNLKRYKDWGYFGIKAKLQQRLVSADTVKDVLQDFFSPADELGVAKRFVGKLKKHGKTEEQIMRSLGSHGFRSDVVRQVSGF